jgi:hypothetical protein
MEINKDEEKKNGKIQRKEMNGSWQGSKEERCKERRK